MLAHSCNSKRWYCVLYRESGVGATGKTQFASKSKLRNGGRFKSDVQWRLLCAITVMAGTATTGGGSLSSFSSVVSTAAITTLVVAMAAAMVAATTGGG